MTQTANASYVGQIIDRKYHLLRVVGEGGMGIVYEARQVVVNRRVAVKFLHPDKVVHREQLNRFHREAQAAGVLESENLVAALDFGIAKGGPGSPYIAMEFLVGETVKALLERMGRLPVERATDLVRQACRGAHVAHVAGIVHRDLNPRNLFVCRHGDGTDLLKVLDFGIAKIDTDVPIHTETRTGTMLGTPAYMSPEQARGDKAIDRRVDVYALGAILYELLSGKKPHPSGSYNAILHHIATQPAIPLDADLDVPPALAAIVERALSREPNDRFATAEELGSELAPWARRSVWPASEAAEEDPLPPPSVSEASLRSLARTQQSPSNRRPARWIWIAGAVGLLAVGLGLASWRNLASGRLGENGAERKSKPKVDVEGASPEAETKPSRTSDDERPEDDAAPAARDTGSTATSASAVDGSVDIPPVSTDEGRKGQQPGGPVVAPPPPDDSPLLPPENPY